MAGAAGHQSPHAVGDDAQTLHRHGPLLHHRLQQSRQAVAVGRNMFPCVVAQIKRCAAQQVGQPSPMIVPLLRPLTVVHAQPMHQQQDMGRRAGNRQSRGPRVPLQPQRVVLQTHLHPQGQRIVQRQQAIAAHAIQGTDHRLPLRCIRRKRISDPFRRCGRQHRRQHPTHPLA